LIDRLAGAALPKTQQRDLTKPSLISMRLNAAALFLAASAVTGASAFTSSSSSSSSGRTTRTLVVDHRLHATPAAAAASVVPESATNNNNKKTTADPLLIRAAKGQATERTPVWMMRQAGRHIKEYRDLVKKYPTFRERSEIPDVAVEVSLQPWRNYQTDGCILFSDILTPLPGMGVDFTIDEKLGPIMEPIRSYDEAKKVSVVIADCPCIAMLCFALLARRILYNALLTYSC
jgi:uroporphyrinogen decarboxylase